MRISRTYHFWFFIGILVVLLISTIACAGTADMVEAHSFSNLVIDGNNLWFGTGYKLYRVDLNKQTATLIYDTNDVVISVVQIDGKMLFFGGHQSPSGNDGVIWSLDLDTESIIWKREFTDYWAGGWVFTPLLVDNKVIIFGAKTSLYGINKTNGRIEWRIEDNWFGEFTPLLADSQLFYGIDNEYFGGDETLAGRTIAIVNPHSGVTVRTISIPGRLGGTPTIHGDCLFVKDYEHYRRDSTGKLQWIGELRLNCLELSSGQTIWTFQGYGVAVSSRLAFYDGLVIDVFANQLYAIDEQTGGLYWQSPELDAAARNPQVIEELGVIGVEVLYENEVVFVDLKTGKLRTKALLNTLSSPVFIGGEAIYGTTNAIVRVNISTGNIIWSIPVDSKYQVYLDD